MRIQFQNDLSKSPNQININQNLTKCAKMTEEGDTIRNGMNGSANIHNFSYSRSKVDLSQKSSNEVEGTVLASASEKQSNNGPVLGGRLQFFKGT